MPDIQGLRTQILANFKFMKWLTDEEVQDCDVITIKKGTSYHALIVRPCRRKPVLRMQQPSPSVRTALKYLLDMTSEHLATIDDMFSKDPAKYPWDEESTEFDLWRARFRVEAAVTPPLSPDPVVVKDERDMSVMRETVVHDPRSRPDAPLADSRAVKRNASVLEDEIADVGIAPSASRRRSARLRRAQRWSALIHHSAAQYQNSRNNNPNFYFLPPSSALTIGATYFTAGFFSNGTIGYGGVANEASIASFDGAYFNTNGTVSYQPEQIPPQGWYRRGFPMFLSEGIDGIITLYTGVAAILGQPDLFGANTGTAGDFNGQQSLASFAGSGNYGGTTVNGTICALEGALYGDFVTVLQQLKALPPSLDIPSQALAL
ncbi:hypothetical protein D6D17_03852 [Aureobasidium pullulans]|nr:hypothetical protein D6D17_03852 [Aureobasidium pullulans]